MPPLPSQLLSQHKQFSHMPAPYPVIMTDSEPQILDPAPFNQLGFWQRASHREAELVVQSQAGTHPYHHGPRLELRLVPAGFHGR